MTGPDEKSCTLHEHFACQISETTREIYGGTTQEIEQTVEGVWPKKAKGEGFMINSLERPVFELLGPDQESSLPSHFLNFTKPCSRCLANRRVEEYVPRCIGKRPRAHGDILL